ncbi:MAG: DUF2231 domain-containing protein [Nocardioides sp.]
MEINGLPLHPLVVHAAVVAGPVAALTALAYLVPRWRERLRWPMLGLAMIAFVSIWVAYLTGDNFRDDARFEFAQGVFLERLERHEDVANVLRWVITGFAGGCALAAGLHERTGATRLVLNTLVGAGAVATVVFVVLTGDAGSQAVYGQ